MTVTAAHAIAVASRIKKEYAEVGYLTLDMQRDLMSVGIDPVRFSIDTSLTIANQGATR